MRNLIETAAPRCQTCCQSEYRVVVQTSFAATHRYVYLIIHIYVYMYIYKHTVTRCQRVSTTTHHGLDTLKGLTSAPIV